VNDGVEGHVGRVEVSTQSCVTGGKARERILSGKPGTVTLFPANCAGNGVAVPGLPRVCGLDGEGG
jgi:hypothetical protein